MKLKTPPAKPEGKKINTSESTNKHPQLKTDNPLSEKDEVKKAEKRTNQLLKKHS